MKRKHFALISLILFAFSCKKSETVSTEETFPDVTGIKVISISPLAGTLVYTNNRLMAIGTEECIYNDAQRITLTKSNSTAENRTVSLYQWKNNTLEYRIDTSHLVIMEHLRYGNSPSSSNKVYVTTTTTNHYFYSNNKLDSIHSVGGLNSYVTDSNRKTIIFNYGADGEIVSKIEKTPISTLLLGNTAYEVRETEYEYDNHPNPFYLLYRQNGLFLKQLEDFNFSIHNPIKQTTTITTDTGITKSSVNIYYEYNELGLPTKIQHGSSPIATTIEYQR